MWEGGGEGIEQTRREGKQKFKKKEEAGSSCRRLKERGLESLYESMMFTSTLLQDFFIFIYLLFISHWPLLFYNNIAIHCKMLYANLS